MATETGHGKNWLPGKDFFFSWKRFGAPACAIAVFVLTTILFIVETTHLKGKTPDGPQFKLGTNIKSECTSYIANSDTATTTGVSGVLHYSKAGAPFNAKIVAVSELETSNLSLYLQNTTDVTSSSGLIKQDYAGPKAWGDIDAPTKLHAFAGTQSNLTALAGSTGAVKEDHSQITRACNAYKPKDFTMIGYSVDVAEAPSVIQALTLMLWLLSLFVMVNEIMNANDFFNPDIEMVQTIAPAGFNSSRIVSSFFTFMIWALIISSVSIGYSSALDFDHHNADSWREATLAFSVIAVCWFLVVIAVRFVVAENEYKCCVNDAVNKWTNIMFYSVFTNFMHIWITCFLLVIGILDGMHKMVEPCGHLKDIFTSTEHLQNYITASVNVGTVSGWSISSLALMNKVKVFEENGSCTGLATTAWTMSLLLIFPIGISMGYPFYKLYLQNMQEEPSVHYGLPGKPGSANVQDVSKKASTELHPLTADTLNF